MCGRYTLRHTTQQIVARFEVAEVIDATFAEMRTDAPRYNIAPTQPVAVVTENSPRVLEMMRWGLVPSWAKDPSIGNRLLNARAETLTEKPSFRTALSRRRCLIPADGFYEWKKQGKDKQPVCIHRKDDALFAFAGLWDEWISPNGSPLRSCTIITVGPNNVMASIHNRMPAMLCPEDERDWLNGSIKSVPDLLSLLAPYPDEEIEAYSVSNTVNSVGNDVPACIEAIDARSQELTLPL
jgi:putative SOS response-associated peptidase YedK